jgi:hypothetical protein
VLPLTATADRWTQDELPATDAVASEDLRRVVLVTSDDVLNVRSGPGVDNEIVGMLAPDVTVIATGRTAAVGASTWNELETPAGPGWVNGFFLGAVVPTGVFAGNADVVDLLTAFSDALAADADIAPFVSERGLYVAHNAPPVRFERDRLDTLMSDATTYRWGSAALSPDDPEIPQRTFAEAVGDSFVSVFDDPDVSVKYDEAELGGNGIPAEYAIPFEFDGLHFVSLYDSGDDPQYGGLDWKAWYVSIDFEDGEPVVVGLTVNEWSP